MLKLSREVLKHSGLCLTNHMSISGLALKTYTMEYIGRNEEKEAVAGVQFPIVSGHLEKAIRAAGYRGGLIHVQPGTSAQSGYMYDVKSLYPAIIIKPLPGGNIAQTSSMDLTNPTTYGFAYALCRAPDDKVPCLLPVNNPLGKVNECVGGDKLFTGLFFTDELRYAQTQGYKVITYGGFQMKPIYKAFNHWVEGISAKRDAYVAEGNHTIALVTKLIINSLYGRFGMDPTMPQTQIVDFETIEPELARDLTDAIDFHNGKFLVTTSGSHEVPALSSRYMDQALEKTAHHAAEKKQIPANASLPLAIAIASHARIFMAEYINLPGNPVLYSDTDSVFVRHPLPEDMVGEGLGQMVFKGKFTDALFLGPKWYTYLTEDGQEVVKSAGTKHVKRSDLVEAFYEGKANYVGLIFERDIGAGTVRVRYNNRSINYSPNFASGGKTNAIVRGAAIWPGAVAKFANLPEGFFVKEGEQTSPKFASMPRVLD